MASNGVDHSMVDAGPAVVKDIELINANNGIKNNEIIEYNKLKQEFKLDFVKYSERSKTTSRTRRICSTTSRTR